MTAKRLEKRIPEACFTEARWSTLRGYVARTVGPFCSPLPPPLLIPPPPPPPPPPRDGAGVGGLAAAAVRLLAGEKHSSQKVTRLHSFVKHRRAFVVYLASSQRVEQASPPSPLSPALAIPTMTAPSLHFTQNFNVASAAAAEDYVQKMFAGGAGFVKHKESGSLFDRTTGVSPKRRAGSHSDLHPPTNLPVYCSRPPAPMFFGN